MISQEVEEVKVDNAIPFGTLDFILTIEDENFRKNVAVTVGHVIGEQGKLIGIGETRNRESVDLTIFKDCERFLDRSDFRSK